MNYRGRLPCFRGFASATGGLWRVQASVINPQRRAPTTQSAIASPHERRQPGHPQPQPLDARRPECMQVGDWAGAIRAYAPGLIEQPLLGMHDAANLERARTRYRQ